MRTRAGTFLSHIAFWPAIYVASAVEYVLQMARVGLEREHGAALLFASLTAGGAYLFDRVKLRDSWLDPADARARPERMAFLTRHAAVVRGGALACLVAASALAFTLANAGWLAVLPVAGALGIVAYAGLPRRARPRVKDRLALKNASVAAGVTVFAMLTALGWPASPESLGGARLACIAATLAWRVVVDAMLCDLDDRESDAHYGTRTLPTLVGHASAWNAGMIARLVLAAAIVATPCAPFQVRVAWGVATSVSSIALRVLSPARISDWVDARFGLESLAVALFLRLGS